MKKLLTLAAAGLLGLAGFAQDKIPMAEDRSAWTISGCSEQNYDATEGGFDEIMDDNTSTYWHSSWNAGEGYSITCPHYFVIDRGDNAASNPIDGFGYLPRQGTGNGHVTAYRLYVLNDITGLNTVHNTNAETHVTDDHASLTTFLNGKTPTKQGTFDIDQADAAKRGLQQAFFDASQTGRYVLFVVDNTSSSVGAGKHANCAEFYLYHYVASTSCTLTFKRSSDDGSPLVLQKDLELSQAFPEYEGFTCSNTGLVSSDNTTAEYVMNEGEPFYLFNERKSSYVRSNNDNSGLTQEVVETPGAEAQFEMIPMGSDGFAIWYPAAGKFVGNIVGANATTPLVEFTATPQKYYTGKQDAPATYMSWIGNTASKNGWNYFNDLNGTGVCGYSWNDAGSKWVIVTNLEKFKENWALRQTLQAAIPNYEAMLEVLGETDTEGLKAWAESYDFGGDVNVDATAENQAKIDKILNITLRADIVIAKRRGNKLATLDFITEEGKAAWTASLAQLENAPDNEETLAALNAALDELGKATVAESVSMKFQSTHIAGDYLGANIGYGNPIAPEPRRWGGGDVCRTWTLQSANGTGFYLFNEYTNKYLKHPANAGGNPTFVSEASAASVYLIRVFDYSDNATFGLKAFGDNVAADFAYLRSDDANAILGGGEETVPSWAVEMINAEDATNDNLAGAKFYYNSLNNVLSKGSGVGQYTEANPEESEAALAVETSASDEEKRNAATTLFNVQFTLNLPQPGHFYRLKGERYLSSTETDSRFDMVEDADGNKVETIWYYCKDEVNNTNRLVAFTNGKVISKCTGGNYVTVLSTDANAGSVEFAESASTGKYLFKVINSGATRYLYHANDQHKLDAGGSEPGSNAGYHWTIEQVNWLPVPGSDKEYTAIYSPVVLKNRDVDNMRANAVNVTDGTATTTALTGDVPANTPVLLEFTSDIERNSGNHLVYLEIDYNAVQAQAETADAESPFKGGIYATAKAEGTSYFTTQAQEDKVNFYALTDANVPGFASHIEVPTAEASESYTISNPTPLAIEEISLDSKAGADVIYDLQGRRVSKATRGVYIVNGKKIYVK